MTARAASRSDADARLRPTAHPVPLRDRRLGRRRQVDARRAPAARLEGDPRRPARAGRPHVGRARLRRTATSTSRCSPTACAPSASRASRSTSPTATSPPGARSFILADCPGHVQYTRNMVTGATTADAVVVLIDGRKGVLEQTRRHLAVVALLRVPHVIVAVNKIDLLGYSRGGLHARSPPRSRRVDRRARHRRRRTSSPSRRSRATTSSSAPSARPGTTARRCSSCSSRCRRRTSSRPALEAFRLPVQLVLRPQGGLAPDVADAPRPSAPRLPRRRRAASPRARCASATGSQIFPAGIATTVTGIDARPAASSTRPSAPAVGLAALADDVDAARGAVIVAAGHPARAHAASVDAELFQLDARPLHARRPRAREARHHAPCRRSSPRSSRATTSTRSRTSPPTASRSTTSAACACAWPPTCRSSRTRANRRGRLVPRHPPVRRRHARRRHRHAT